MPPRNGQQRRTTDKRKVTGLNLDTLKREIPRPDQPYVAILAGRPITIGDPMDKHWQDLSGISPDDIIGNFRPLMSAADWQHFEATPIPFWMLVQLYKDVREYYKVTEQDLGNAIASPTS